MAAAAWTDCVRVPTLFDDCTTTSIVSDQFGSATRKSQLTTAGNRPCIQMTGLDGTLQVRWTKAAAISLQADAECIYVLMRCSDPYLLEQGTATQVYWFPETSAGSDTVDTTNTLNGGLWSVEEVGDGWTLVCVPFSLMTVAGSATVTDQRTKRTMRIAVRVTVASGTKPDVYIGGIWIGGAQRTKLVLAYDGCYISQKTLAKVAHDLYDIPGTLYVPWSVVDQSASYLSTSDLDVFYAAGWDICPHSFSGVALSTLTYQQMVDEIGNAQRAQLGRGYTRGVDHLAWAYNVGSSNADATIRANVYAALRASGVKTVRVGGAGSGLTHLRPLSQGLSLGTIEDLPKTIYSPQLTSGLSIAQARASVETMIRHRLPGHVYCHEIAANQGATVSGSASNYITPTNYDQTTTPGATQSWMPWLNTMRAQGSIDLVTISDWYTSLTQPALVV